MNMAAAAANPRVSALLGEGLQHQQRRDFATAEARYREALGIEPGNPDAAHLFATLAQDVGRTDIAISLFNQVIAALPEYLPSRVALGWTLLSQGQAQEAVAAFRWVLSRAPQEANIWLGLGAALRATGALGEATTAYRRAIDTDPSLLAAQVNLGHIAFECDNLLEASRCYHAVLSSDPRMPDAHYGLGLVAERGRDFPAARAHQRRALMLDPVMAPVHEALGRLLSRDALVCWCGGTCHAAAHALYGRCADCGTFVLRERFDPVELQQFYGADDYWRRYVVQTQGFPPIEERAVSDFNDRIPVWHQQLLRARPQGADRVLEIGCAHGGFLEYCRQRGTHTVVGVEVDEGTCRFARERFGLPHVVSGLFPAVALPVETFDAIVGFDVLERFTDPVGALVSMRELLAPGGVCLFQTPCYRGEGVRWAQFKPVEHLYLLDERSVRALLARAGLEVVSIEPGLFPDDMFVVARAAAFPGATVAGASRVRALPERVDRLLWVRPDSIGDAVLASAMLEPLRARFPKASVVVVCQEHIAAFYRHCPLVDDVITFQRQSFIDDAGYRQSVVRALRDFDADLAVCSVFSRDQIGEMLTVECGARFIVGCDGDGANLPVAEAARGASRYDMNVPANGQWGSELDRHSDLLSALDPSYDRRTSPLVPRVWTSAEDAESASEILVDLGWSSEDTLVLFAGAQYAIRHYPGYAQALRSTCREQGLKVIALGVLGERELNQQVLDQLDVPVRNLCGSLSMGETVEVIRRARVAIGAETGYAHIACAVGTPNVVVLGGGHFGRFMPWSPLTRVACLPLSCYACNWHCRFSQAHCIQDLPAGVVQVALRAALGPACAHPQFYLAADSSWSPGPASPGWAWPSGLLAPGLVEGFFVGRDGAIEQMDARSAPGGLVSLVSVP